MNDTVALVLSAATLAQVGLVLSILLSRTMPMPVYWTLVAVLFELAILATGPVVWHFWPAGQIAFIAAIIPVWLMLAPSLWLYVEGLTSTNIWRPRAQHGYHFIPMVGGILLSLSVWLLPSETRQQIFFQDVEPQHDVALAVVIALFLFMLFWAFQSSYYALRILRQLARYREQLKNLFANNDNRELGWLSWLIYFIGALWLLAFVSLLMTLIADKSLFEHRGGALLFLLLVWSLGHWGLKQKPGFDGRYLDHIQQEALSAELEKAAQPKYQRSALGEEQAQRIAAKIQTAMKNEQMFLDANLSLYKLSQALAISPNYISQTLNETMGTSFFDYVNQYRIHFAIPKILANTDSVLNIALESGFNARSSFYKAFKQETGFTPTEYRKQHTSNT